MGVLAAVVGSLPEVVGNPQAWGRGVLHLEVASLQRRR